MLYRRGKALLEEAEQLERAAAKAAAGWEAELRIAAEIIFPTWLLLECLDTLSIEQPQMRIQLHESVLAGTSELLISGRVDMAIASSIPGGFIGSPLMQVRFIAAAAPNHPLHQLDRPLSLDDLRQHRHLIVRDTGSQPTGEGAPRVTEQRWVVSAKATSIRAACMGLGFAWYAEESSGANWNRVRSSRCRWSRAPSAGPPCTWSWPTAMRPDPAPGAWPNSCNRRSKKLVTL
jgi:DNA-binding transcriptional LysR family regulator